MKHQAYSEGCHAEWTQEMALLQYSSQLTLSSVGNVRFSFHMRLLFDNLHIVPHIIFVHLFYIHTYYFNLKLINLVDKA